MVDVWRFQAYGTQRGLRGDCLGVWVCLMKILRLRIHRNWDICCEVDGKDPVDALITRRMGYSNE